MKKVHLISDFRKKISPLLGLEPTKMRQDLKKSVSNLIERVENVLSFGSDFRYIRKCFYFSFLDSKLNEKRPDAVQKMISTSILYSIHCCTVLRITSFPSSGFTPVVTVNTLGRNLVNPTSEALCCSLGLLQHNMAALARAKACLLAVGTSSFKGLPYISLASSLKN